MKNLAGKTVLLTGASRGLGVYIARALAREQATVICVSRSKLELDTTCEQINALGGKGVSIPFDIQDVEKISHLVQYIRKNIGPLDILINNAGIEIRRCFIDYSTEEIQSTLKTNLLSPMELTRLFLPDMLERHSGHIVNIASLSGKKAVAYSSIYSASKAGLIMWNDAIRQELVGTGVKTSVICPGYISQVGMFAKSNLSAPYFAGTSTPIYVTNAVLRAIKQNKAEIILNREPVTEHFAKTLFAISQFCPKLVDAAYRWMGLTEFTKTRLEKTKAGNIKIINSVASNSY